MLKCHHKKWINIYLLYCDFNLAFVWIVSEIKCAGGNDFISKMIFIGRLINVNILWHWKWNIVKIEIVIFNHMFGVHVGIQYMLEIYVVYTKRLPMWNWYILTKAKGKKTNHDYSSRNKRKNHDDRSRNKRKSQSWKATMSEITH